MPRKKTWKPSQEKIFNPQSLRNPVGEYLAGVWGRPRRRKGSP